MKAILFVQNGLTTPEHLVTKFEYSSKGHQLILSNGSTISGFEDSCDKIIMDCENARIIAWAEKKGIPVEDYGVQAPKVKTAPAPRDDYSHNIPSEDLGIDIDELVASQVAKAEVEAEVIESEEPKEHAMPFLSKILVGEYTDPEGNKYERKKGPKLKGDLKAAILKFGFDQLTFKESE